MIITLISVVILGWFLASTIGTCAYFANESTSEKSLKDKWINS